MPVTVLRNAYRGGQCKVDTTEIQAQQFNVKKEVLELYKKRFQKLAESKITPDDQVYDSLKTCIDQDVQVRVGSNLDQKAGGVCHGLVFAWFRSLRRADTTLDFNVRQGGWENYRGTIKDNAATNQARLNARVLSRAKVLSENEALERAARKLAKDNEFEEEILATSGVSRDCLVHLFSSVLTDSWPRCYRLSVECAGGRHSMALVRKGAEFWLLDPNVGILYYRNSETLCEDLALVLAGRPPIDGYGAASVGIFAVIPVEKELDWEAMMRSLGVQAAASS
jgi:hypothetical protein